MWACIHVLISTKINSGSFAADLSAYYPSTSQCICGCLRSAHSCGSHYSLCALVDIASGANMNTFVIYAESCTYSETVKYIRNVKHFLYLWYIIILYCSKSQLFFIHFEKCFVLFFLFLAKPEKWSPVVTNLNDLYTLNSLQWSCEVWNDKTDTVERR